MISFFSFFIIFSVLSLLFVTHFNMFGKLICILWFTFLAGRNVPPLTTHTHTLVTQIEPNQNCFSSFYLLTCIHTCVPQSESMSKLTAYIINLYANRKKQRNTVSLRRRKQAINKEESFFKKDMHISFLRTNKKPIDVLLQYNFPL